MSLHQPFWWLALGTEALALSLHSLLSSVIAPVVEPLLWLGQ